MKSLLLPISLLLLAALASCGPSDRCAGWEQIQIADATVDYLNTNDRPALQGLVANHRFGQEQGCW